MKLVLLLSVIACGYTAKLDRTYLPPSSAATAGGSPGDLTAPGSTGSFGQGLPNASRGSAELSPTFGQNSGINSPSVPSIQGLRQPSGSSSSSLGFNSINGAPAQSGIENTNTGPSGQGFNNFGSNSQAAKAPFGQTPQSNGQGFVEEFKPERAQTAADRSAEILKYINENNGDSYEYSYETSNGIAAEESGVATDGVRAQGGYSYTGDDGKFYSITYTADENGYQPQGEHLPTPPPIPEEILKSIEDNARAAAAGTQEGAYRPEEYESDSSPQQYNTGSTSNYNQPQQPIPSLQGQGSNQGQIPQGAFNANLNSQRQREQVSSLSGSRTQQQPNKFSQGPATSTQYTQSQSSQGTNLFGNQQGQNQNTQSQNGQGLGENGYNYNRPQGNQPQRGQPQKLSQGLGNTNQGLPRQSSTTPFGNQEPSEQLPQGQRGQDQRRNGYNYNQPQKSAQGLNQFSGQGNQQKRPQTFFSNVEGNDNGLSSQKSSQTASQSNQKQPIRDFNQFNNQQGTNIRDQGENGYNYNQPQNLAQGSKKFPELGGQQSTNNGVFGQQIQPTGQINQPQRSNLFGKQEKPASQYSQREMAQNQRDNGYNYDRPQNQQGSNQLSGQRQSPSKGAFGLETGSSNQFNQPQQPFKGSNNLVGKEREPSNQFSQGQGQNQRDNGYNYNQPKKPTGSAQTFESQSGQPQKISQTMGSKDKLFPGTISGQSNGQFNQPQRQPQSSGQINQGQRNQYTPSQKGQDQDENGYYYNPPQGGSPTSQGPFGQRPQAAQSQSVFPQRPFPSYDTHNNAQALRPSKQGSSFQTRPGSSNSGAIKPSQGSQFPEANKQTSGTLSTSLVSGVEGPIGSSRPNEKYQPNLAPASQFQPQPGSLNAPSQTLAQGYQYNQPEKSQSQRPGFNPTGSQGASGSAGSEFVGPRQPPSFSAEEGYRY